MNGKEERSGRVSLTECKQLKRGGALWQGKTRDRLVASTVLPTQQRRNAQTTHLAVLREVGSLRVGYPSLRLCDGDGLLQVELKAHARHRLQADLHHLKRSYFVSKRTSRSRQAERSSPGSPPCPLLECVDASFVRPATLVASPHFTLSLHPWFRF